LLSKTKKLIHQALVQNILLYGAEAWTLNTQQDNKLLATEIFGEDPQGKQGKKISK
jgi:hypothetical protein